MREVTWRHWNLSCRACSSAMRRCVSRSSAATRTAVTASMPRAFFVSRCASKSATLLNEVTCAKMSPTRHYFRRTMISSGLGGVSFRWLALTHAGYGTYCILRCQKNPLRYPGEFKVESTLICPGCPVATDMSTL